MEPYGGFEPQVGEIRAVRTFRIGPGGVLFPMFSASRWHDGANTARCRRDRADEVSHAAPDPDCTCGFYAYGDEGSSGEYAYARHVLAVVSCWGRVIAGSRGVRAEHARIDALWMSDAVPVELAGAVRRNYPSSGVYADRQTMLQDHPPTRLDCYDPVAPSLTASSRWHRRVAVAAVVAAGVVPVSWLGVVPAWRALLLTTCALLLASAVMLARRSPGDITSRRWSLFCVALGLWVATPLTGATGLFMFRLPLLQIVGLSFVQRFVMLRAASRFPARIS